MGSRAYRRDNQGRFAGSGGGTNVTFGRAGGFANSAFRASVQSGQRASASKSLGATAGTKGRAFAKETGRRAGLAALGSARIGIGLSLATNPKAGLVVRTLGAYNVGTGARNIGEAVARPKIAAGGKIKGTVKGR